MTPTRAWRVPLVALLLVVAGLFLPRAALADSAIDRAATSLDGRPGVYVASGAEGKPLSAAALAEVRSRVQSTDTPIFVAALTDSTKAALQLHLTELIDTVRKDGTYAVLSPAGFYARSNQRGVQGGALASQALAAHPGDPQGAVLEFVDAVSAAAGSTGSVSGSGSSGGSSGGSGASLLGVLALLGLGGGGLALWSKRKRRKRDATALAEVRGAAEEDVTKLGEDIGALTVPDSADEPTRTDYTGALDSYDAAKAALAGARAPEDMRGVTTALEEGRWRMECVRARLAGHSVPERRPPCFFNPQHGPSVTDVSWAPADGTPRTVPACAADAARIQAGGDPDVRQVLVGGAQVPYYAAPAYSSYAGGFFGGWGGGGFLSGLLLGELISGPGMGYGGGFGGYGGGYGGGGYPGGDSYGGGNSGGQGGGDFAGGFDVSGGGGWGGGDGGGGDGGGGGWDGGGGGGGGDSGGGGGWS